jgi:hypothetical protein
MTKIVLNSEAAAPMFALLKTPLSFLLHPAIVAHPASRGTIYVADPYADMTVNRLTEAGVAIQIAKI